MDDSVRMISFKEFIKEETGTGDITGVDSKLGTTLKQCNKHNRKNCSDCKDLKDY